MSNYLYEIIIVVISSGAFGTIVNAISKKRERENINNIENAVDVKTQKLCETMKNIAENQASISNTLCLMRKDIDDVVKKQKELTEKVVNIRKESEEIDFLFLKYLREKKIFNGESDAIYEKILERRENNE